MSDGVKAIIPDDLHRALGSVKTMEMLNMM